MISPYYQITAVMDDGTEHVITTDEDEIGLLAARKIARRLSRLPGVRYVDAGAVKPEGGTASPYLFCDGEEAAEPGRLRGRIGPPRPAVKPQLHSG